MPQIVACPGCSKKLKAPDELAGKQVACPACKAVVSIPPIKVGQDKRPTSDTLVSRSKVERAALASVPHRTMAASAGVIECPGCASKFKGSDKLQGKKVRCPDCHANFVVRLSAQIAPSMPKAKSSIAPPPIPAKTKPTSTPTPGRTLGSAQAMPMAPARPVPPLQPAAAPPTQAKHTPPKPLPIPKSSQISAFFSNKPRLLYLAFALCFVPLVFQILTTKSDVEERLTHTFASHPELEKKLENLKSKSDLFALFPDGRIEGAHLSYFSRTHWVYAAIAAAAFFVVCWLLFDPGRASVAQWFIVFGVTSTVGIVSLLAFQWIADVTQGVWITGRSILVLLFYIVKFIGFSYRAATDENTGFLLSFVGFTFGVGLCEEVTKALPMIVWLGEDKKLDWRAACVLGLASGVGFGVAEGIMYSGHYYNGVMSGDIYLTRFISCVALHATWTAAVCLMAVQNLSGFNTSEAKDWFLHLLMIIAVPVVLHGLYDTLLKKGMDGYALAVALASFAWLAFMLERARNANTDYTPRRVVHHTAV
jgi:RsiW-degrading membrane proteinase PrsW (M82 family)